jgi:endonuclease III
VKHSADRAKRLHSLLAGLDDAPRRHGPDDPLGLLIYSFLLWESDHARAATGYETIHQQIVDANDLRVTMPHELQVCFAEGTSRSEERAERLRACLRDVYAREHDVTLESLQGLGKRDVRKYLESLEGMVPFVSARVLLLSFGAHGMPADEQLRDALIEEDIVDPNADIPGLASWLARQIKAEDAVDAHHRLQHWVEHQIRNETRSGRGRKTTRKTATRAKSESGNGGGKKKKSGKKTTRKKASA